MMAEKFSLALKWGSLKGWNNAPPEALELIQRWSDLGNNVSAMMHHDTPEQKEIVCQIIDLVDGDLYNDWSGEYMTKDEAKSYVMTYGKKRAS